MSKIELLLQRSREASAKEADNPASALEIHQEVACKLLQIIEAKQDAKGDAATFLTRVTKRIKHLKARCIEVEQVVGHEDAKRALDFAIRLPALHPHLFTGMRTPWRAILLYGPPGTGKTQLVRNCAATAGIEFVAVTAADISSRFYGDSEKAVRTLFENLRAKAPALLFIDEADLCMAAGGSDTHDATLRVKSEILQQMSGVFTSSTDRVVVVMATNHPEHIDPAVLRRLEKRIYVGMPTHGDRATILRQFASKNKHSLSDADFDEIARRTEGYSGSDLRRLAREAAMRPVEQMILQNKATTEIPNIAIDDYMAALEVCMPSVRGEVVDACKAFELKKNV